VQAAAQREVKHEVSECECSITATTLNYLKKINTHITKAGFKATIYQATNRAYLALLLKGFTFDELLNQLDEKEALQILAIIAEAISKDTATCQREQSQ
jgi:hypothetical protein